ncbi:MAG: transposase [Deltaproteobacteria bacterium]|nr:transposase [Deltaproteobacteria bacterium]
MARSIRIEYRGAFYHVTARGNERKRIFFNEADYQKFKEYVGRAQDKFNLFLHCYMLMTNHYHLILETPEGNLTKVMHYLNGSYTNYVNRRRRRIGHLLQGRYKAILIDKDNYLLELSRYVHLNPVRAKMVAKPEDYVFSSYRSYIDKKNEKIVHRDLILSMVSKESRDSRKKYMSFVERGREGPLDDPLKKAYGGAILGGKRFIKDVLDRVKPSVIQNRDISHRRELQSAYALDRIVESVAVHFGISTGEVKSSKALYRNMAIYLVKKWTSIKNIETGEFFGGLSYSAVSKINARFSEKLKKDKKIRRDVQEIMTDLSQVKA